MNHVWFHEQWKNIQLQDVKDMLLLFSQDLLILFFYLAHIYSYEIKFYMQARHMEDHFMKDY